MDIKSDRLKNDPEVTYLAVKDHPQMYFSIGSQLKDEIGDQDVVKYLQYIIMKEKVETSITEKATINKSKLKI